MFIQGISENSVSLRAPQHKKTEHPKVEMIEIKILIAPMMKQYTRAEQTNSIYAQPNNPSR